MRVSAGFLEIGLSGKIRMYSLPPRLTWREIAIRAASIWREVTNPHDSACSAYSPNATSVAPFERPVIRPFCCLRHLTVLGASIFGFPLFAARAYASRELRCGRTSPLKIQHLTPIAP